MPLDVLALSGQVRQMGALLARRRAEEHHRLRLVKALLQAYQDRWQDLANLAEQARTRVAVPTGPLDERVPAPPRAQQYTALAADGAEIDPDRHGGGGEFYVVNVGYAKIPYGQPERQVELRSTTRLGFTDDDLFIVDPRDPRRQVPMRDRHLDALRTVQEVRTLAELAHDEAAQHAGVPAIALVDGTLLFSVLEERPRDFLRARFFSDFVDQLERLRQCRVPVAAYASRSRGVDLVNLFRWVSGVPDTALRGLTDAQLLGPGLARWERSAVFRVRSNVHDPYYAGHQIFFFLLHIGGELARVEVPEWVAQDRPSLDSVHAALVDQCAKGFGYPAVLARADDRAVISLNDRGVLEMLVRQELARRGIEARPSAKLIRKQVRTV
jgi:hypothetical protein